MCSFSLWSEAGSQISVNFLDMDLAADQSSGSCSTDFVQLLEGSTSSSALVGSMGQSFCGQTLPNYPGPSVVVSGQELRINITVYDY